MKPACYNIHILLTTTHTRVFRRRKNFSTKNTTKKPVVLVKLWKKQPAIARLILKGLESLFGQYLSNTESITKFTVQVPKNQSEFKTTVLSEMLQPFELFAVFYKVSRFWIKKRQKWFLSQNLVPFRKNDLVWKNKFSWGIRKFLVWANC